MECGRKEPYPGQQLGRTNTLLIGRFRTTKVLTIEHSALTRTTIGQTNIDAKLCYDRILRPVAALASYKYGLPLNICQWVILILNLQEYYIITTNGKSKENYKWPKSHPLHGIGQGSTAAPIIWLLISSTLFLSMQKWMKGITTQRQDGKHKTTRYADAFVDNTAVWANKEPSTTALLQRMEKELKNVKK